MSYQAEISRANPMCLILLIDQSGSMSDSWGGQSNQSKADAVATIVNRLLTELVISQTVGNDVYNRFDLAIIGYGGIAEPALGGTLTGKELVGLSELAMNPLRVEERTRQVEDGAGGLVEEKIKFPVWFDPRANGGTPMCAALEKAEHIVSTWILEHPDGFPPEVINISDGEPTDGNPMTIASRIQEISSNDGSTLIFNAHISSANVHNGAIQYPSTNEGLPDQHAILLFSMSSILPEVMRNRAQQVGVETAPDARGFLFNATAIDLINFLDIGSRAALR